MARHKQRDWRELCAAVTNETDSTKLDSLVQELIKALDEGEREWRHPSCSAHAMGVNREARPVEVTTPAKPVWLHETSGPDRASAHTVARISIRR